MQSIKQRKKFKKKKKKTINEDDDDDDKSIKNFKSKELIIEWARTKKKREKNCEEKRQRDFFLFSPINFFLIDIKWQIKPDKIAFN